MTIAVETCLVVAMAFAVFAAITALGSSLVLGIGFERLRAGFEVVKSQTGFFSDAIHKLDGRVNAVEKQGSYFFESLHKIEAQQQELAVAKAPEEALETAPEPMLIKATGAPAPERAARLSLWDREESGREVSFH